MGERNGKKEREGGDFELKEAKILRSCKGIRKIFYPSPPMGENGEPY